MKHSIPNLKGPSAILTTPFLENGVVDLDTLLFHVEALCETGITGIIPCGSTGEFISADFTDNVRLMKEVARVAKGRKRLIGGATGADAPDTLRYMQAMQELGYDAALVAPPIYFRHGDEEITAFYQELATCELPVVAYNIPFFTSPISMTVYEKLLEMPHVVAIKNSSANIKEILHQIQLKKQRRPDFSVLTGTDDALLPCVASGCIGSFTALAGITPNTVCRIYEALENRDLDAAQDLQDSLLPMLRAADSLPFPVGYKLLAHAAGWEMGYLRQSLPTHLKERLPVLLDEMRGMLAELEGEHPLRELPPLSM